MEPETIYLLALVVLFVILLILGCVAALAPALPSSVKDYRLADAARQRAERLLCDVLTDGELHHLKTHGYLDVPSPVYPGRTYRVFRGGGPVQVREDGRASVLLCVQPLSYLPEADVVLMHKLMIEGAERNYLRTANVVRT